MGHPAIIGSGGLALPPAGGAPPIGVPAREVRAA